MADSEGLCFALLRDLRVWFALLTVFCGLARSSLDVAVEPSAFRVATWRGRNPICVGEVITPYPNESGQGFINGGQ